jgi:DNA (cytosine-5)-methyltransferase 1
MIIRQENLSSAIPQASQENLRRMAWLIERGEYNLPNELRPKCHRDEHSYKSMYGRLSWMHPAQTITSGFTSMGQGRYMHPDQARALTCHEAARIQGFPDYFDFGAAPTRSSLTRMIGNAVPPALACEVFRVLLQHHPLAA